MKRRNLDSHSLTSLSQLDNVLQNMDRLWTFLRIQHITCSNETLLKDIVMNVQNIVAITDIVVQSPQSPYILKEENTILSEVHTHASHSRTCTLPEGCYSASLLQKICIKIHCCHKQHSIIKHTGTCFSHIQPLH